MFQNLNVEKQLETIFEKSPRCGGGGYLPQFHYYEDGRCFRCQGKGTVFKKTYYLYFGSKTVLRLELIVVVLSLLYLALDFLRY